ncbi:MAG: lipid IV(A) 3-deoxy-D-manno-octulosonic acid transferase [Pseudomonadota bacterium]|nr:lipid IV(A) 3-deoxy-D-manno-octulosonic acid transferase [Pseudomonadota bacterium]
MHRQVYTLAFYLLLPIYFVRLFLKGINNKEYLSRWPERLGIAKNTLSREKNLIWIHAVSVGEVNASIPLLRRLKEEYEDIEILVTTTTPTGSKLVKERLGSSIQHQYLPVDIPICVNRFLNVWQPRILILLETEIWPNLLYYCKKRGICTALVNARLSEKSQLNYQKFISLMQPAFESIDIILAQFDSDKVRLNEITKHKSIDVCGNLKFDQAVPHELKEIATNIKKDWAIDGELRPTLIAASTHEGEEEIVLNAFNIIQETHPNSLLILVPRHLERFDQVKELLKESKLDFVTRSNKSDVTKTTKVLLGDTIGELNFLYSLSSVAFVGGSLIDHGGQNLLEPAAQGLAILSGPNLRNFSDISKQLISNNALDIISNSLELSERFLFLIQNKEIALERGQSAYKVFSDNRGALDNIFNKIKPSIDNSI